MATAAAFDLVVIGGGSGGVACSKAAAVLGARVAMLDFVAPSPQGTTWGVGGTCVNVGCIPKKLMHTAALHGDSITASRRFGWEVAQPAHSWSHMTGQINNFIRGSNFRLRTQLRAKNVEYINALGRFKDAHTIECTDSEGSVTEITGSNIVIAVGGRPTPLDCPGGELAIDSDDIFWRQKPPGKVCVVGASYVGLECAGFLNGLGLDVTCLCAQCCCEALIVSTRTR